MTLEAENRVQLERIQRLSLMVGVAGLVLLAIGALFYPRQLFHSYLIGFLMWLGISLGSLAILMMQYLTGGAWGILIRRTLESAARTLPLMAIMFIPLLLGLRSLYVWTHPGGLSGSEALEHKRLYLNIPFFLVRAVGYFAIWITLSQLLSRWSFEQDRTTDPGRLHWLGERFQRLSGPGLVLYALTILFASTDWIMSLEPEWRTTILGILIMGGQGLGAFAFAILVTALLSERKPISAVARPDHFHDLGNLLLAFIMLWAYFSFSQLLIVWSGDLPEESPWYLRRLQNGGEWIAMMLIIFHFALPFSLLLLRENKRKPHRLAMVAGLVIFMRVVDLIWIVGAELDREKFYFHWMDLVAPIGLGGIWLAYFIRQLKERPLLPLQDPVFREAVTHGRE
jgi:hypothetical protein